MAGNDWSQNEVNLIVRDYFDMLQLELEKKNFSKTAHRIALLPLLDSRSESSIEFKHRNISAVLVNMGLPYIKGYKPLFNTQRELLEEEVSAYLIENRIVFERDFELFSDSKVTPINDYQVYFDYILENPPSSSKPIENEVHFRPIKINYLEREQNNRQLGESGESLIVNYEKWRLNKEGKPELARQVDWVSKEKGDGMGFDILSKNTNGTDRYIEVKTTKLSKETPIYLTRTEIIFASQHSEQFFLYRVFNFDSKPQFFIREGDYEDYCKLQPLTFKGYF